jgi:hypothetical protein
MSDQNKLKTEHKVAEDNTKTETIITGGEPFKAEDKTPNMEVVTETTVDPNDNNKTLVSLSAPESGFKVKVIGPFNGEVEVLPGTELRVALAKLNKDDDTFGKYKYRDEAGNPIGIKTHVEKDLILTSLAKS